MRLLIPPRVPYAPTPHATHHTALLYPHCLLIVMPHTKQCHTLLCPIPGRYIVFTNTVYGAAMHGTVHVLCAVSFALIEHTHTYIHTLSWPKSDTHYKLLCKLPQNGCALCALTLPLSYNNVSLGSCAKATPESRREAVERRVDLSRAVPAAHSLVEDRGISVTSYDGYAPPLPSFQNGDLGDLRNTKKKLCVYMRQDAEQRRCR